MFTNVHPFRRWNGCGITFPGERKSQSGRVIDQAWFCEQVAATNKLEFLKWAREVKHCEWDEKTIKVAAFKGNLEMLKYCFSNGCPCDEEKSCKQAAGGGHLDCLRFLFDKVKPSRDLLTTGDTSLTLGTSSTRVRKLLARKRVSRTNGRTIRYFCRGLARARVSALKQRVRS